MDMPRIEISDYDFKRLQAYAEPFVDTPATALTKVLDQLAQGTKARAAGPAILPSTHTPKTCAYGPNSLPPLTHTKVISGRLGDAEPQKATWDALVRLALESLHRKYNDVLEIKKRSGVNIVAGSKSDEGYKYLPELGFSYQGVAAEDAAKILLRSARDLEADLVIEFVWRDKPEAFKPGQGGRIEA